MSMGHALEVYPVLLDHVLVEHAVALPPEFKIRDGRPEAVLKDAVADLFMSALLTRPKTGFELLWGHWLRTVLRERLQAEEAGSAARGLFDATFLDECLSRMDEPEMARLLYTLLVLISWLHQHNMHLDRSHWT